MVTLRILVTASRDWDDYHTLSKAIAIAISDLTERFGQGLKTNTIEIVHGACETGGDPMVEEFVNKVKRSMLKYNVIVKTDPHPANWNRECDKNCYHKITHKNGKKICSAAGPIRNKKMVDLGADLCLAFIKGASPGATGCAKLAERAGVEVRYYRR